MDFIPTSTMFPLSGLPFYSLQSSLLFGYTLFLVSDTCISRKLICDGDFDCRDKSDEDSTLHRCDQRSCSPSEFSCVKTRKCIPIRYKCDGDNDCGDASDESPSQGCTIRTCTANEFR